MANEEWDSKIKNNEDSHGVSRPPLVDPTSAYQNGMLDAVNGRVNLSFVLIAAEQRVLNDRYCEGYAAGCNLTSTPPYRSF